MADDRSDPGSAGAGEDVHDDDELADVLAAELQRYATGAVPIVARDGQEAPPAVIPPAVAGRPVPPTLDPPLVTAPAPAELRGRRSAPSEFGRRVADFDRAVTQDVPVQDPAPASFRRPYRDRPAPAAPAPEVGLSTAELPVRRRSGYRPPAGPRQPQPDPMERVLPTGPVVLPETTASLLGEMVAESAGAPAHASRHAAPPAAVPPPPVPAPPVSAPPAPAASGPGGAVQPGPAQAARPEPAPERDPEPTAPTPVAPVAPTAAPLAEPAAEPPLTRRRVRAEAAVVEPPLDPAADALRGTGQLDVPRGLYTDWEQSLRSIGRPRAAWEDDEEVVPQGSAGIDAPTVALTVQQPAGPAPRLPEPVQEEPERPRRPGRRRRPVPPEPVPAEPVVQSVQIAEPEAPTAALVEVPAGSLRDVDEEGVDDVAVDYPEVSAATTGAIDLPVVEPRPSTAPVLIERVRTALLQLPSVPPSPTGSGAAAVVGRWFGAFASPLVLLLGFGLATTGAGPAAAAAALVGALLALPAAARSGAWAASGPDDAAMQETELLGPALGRAAAVVLVLARLAALVAVLVGTSAVVSAWVGRTGAFGGGAATSALIAVAAVALVATLCAALPSRATAALVLVLAALGAVGSLLLALLLAPSGGAAAGGTPGGAIAAATAGLAAVGLLLVLVGPDVARWRTDLPRPASGAVAAVVAGVLGAVLLVAGILIGARAGATGDPADALAGALSDATASALAAPLAVVLAGAALTLPTLLIRSTGAAAARLAGGAAPVRLGSVAAGLLSLAAALGILATGTDAAGALLAIAAGAGVPVAAWAGLLTTGRPGGRGPLPAVLLAVAVLAGWALADGLLLGAGSPVLDAIGIAGPLRGGPFVGLLVALVLGLAAGATSRPSRSPQRPADTVAG